MVLGLRHAGEPGQLCPPSDWCLRTAPSKRSSSPASACRPFRTTSMLTRVWGVRLPRCSLSPMTCKSRGYCCCAAPLLACTAAFDWSRQHSPPCSLPHATETFCAALVPPAPICGRVCTPAFAHVCAIAAAGLDCAVRLRTRLPPTSHYFDSREALRYDEQSCRVIAAAFAHLCPFTHPHLSSFPFLLLLHGTGFQPHACGDLPPHLPVVPPHIRAS